MKKNENGSLQHSSRMCKRFKISDFEQSCNNEMLTQEDDAEDKDDNYNAYEGNEEELKNENGFCHSSRIRKMLQMSDIEDSCDDELVVIQDAPEDRTDSDKRSEELSYNARKLLEHRKLLSENSTERSKLKSNEKPFSWNDLFKKVNACKLYEALKRQFKKNRHFHQLNWQEYTQRITWVWLGLAVAKFLPKDAPSGWSLLRYWEMEMLSEISFICSFWNSRETYRN